MSVAVVAKEQNIETSVGHFQEIRPAGEVLDGACFTLDGNSILRIPGGDILSTYSKSIRALFGEVRLETLELSVTVDEFGYSQLYDLLGYDATCVAGTSVGSHKRFTAQLVVNENHLLGLAKHTPPSGEPEDRLLGLVLAESHLLQRLDAWDLRTITPHLA